MLIAIFGIGLLIVVTFGLLTIRSLFFSSSPQTIAATPPVITPPETITPPTANATTPKLPAVPSVPSNSPLTTPPPSTTTTPEPKESSPATDTSTGETPGIPTRARTAVKGNDSGSSGESVLPRGEIDQPKDEREERERQEAEEGLIPWSAKPDPPASPIEYKKGKISFPFPSFSDVVSPEGPSNFLMFHGRESDNEVRLVMDLRTGNQIGKPIPGKLETSWDEVFSPDGRYLAFKLSGSSNSILMVYSFATGEIHREITVADKWSNFHFCFGGSHQLIVVHEPDFDTTQVTIWNLKTGDIAQQWSLPRDNKRRLIMDSVTPSPGGKYLALVAGNRIGILDATTGNAVGQVLLKEESWGCEGMAFSPDGTELVVLLRPGSRHQLINIDFATGKVLLNQEYSGTLESFGYDGPTLEWMPDKSGWIYKGHLLLERDTGGEVWTFPRTDSKPRRMMRPGEILVAIRGKNGMAYENVSLPTAEITRALETVRGGGSALDSILPPVSTPDLFSAVAKTLPNGFVQMNAPADGTGLSAKGLERDLLIAKEGEKVQSILLAGSGTPKVVVQKEVTPPAGAGGGRREQKRIIIERLDVASGSKSAPVEIPAIYRLVDVSPSGNFAVVGYSDAKTKVDRIDIIGLNPKKHIAGFRPYAGEKEPEEKDRWRFHSGTPNSIKWVGLLDDEHVLTINQAGKLITWKLPECKAVYYFDQFGDPLAVSPTRRYLAGVHDGQFRLFDSKTGDCVGDLEAPSCGIKPLRAAFRPDGREMTAVIDAGMDRMVVRWNLASGKIEHEFPLPSDLISSYVSAFNRENQSLEYRGPTHLLLDRSYLIDLQKRMIVWKYSMDVFNTTFVSGAADARTWYCMHKGNAFSGPMFLTSCETPSDNVIRKSASANLEKSLLLYPGKSVKLHVDLSAVNLQTLHPTVEKAVTQALDARGIKVDAASPILFSLVAGQRSTGEQIGVSSARSNNPFGHGFDPFGRGRFGGFGGGSSERPEQILDQQEMICRLALSDASGVRWKRDPRVAMRDYGTVEVGNAQGQLQDEMYRGFMNMLSSDVVATSGMPTYVFYPLEESLPGESKFIFGGETAVQKNLPAAGAGGGFPNIR